MLASFTGHTASVATVPLLLLVLLVGLTLAIRRHEVSRELDDVNEDARLLRDQIAARLERSFEGRQRMLEVLTSESKLFSAEDVAVAARYTCKVTPNCCRVWWLDAAGNVRFAVGPNGEVDASVPRTAGWPALWQAARAHGSCVISAAFDDPVNGRCVILLAPMLADQSRGSGTILLGGGAACQLRLTDLVYRSIEPSVLRSVDVRLDDPQKTAYVSLPRTEQWGPADPSDAELVHLPNAEWKVYTRPSAVSLATAVHARGPRWILILGLSASVLISSATLVANRYRRRQLDQARAYSDAMERLRAISAAIIAKPGSAAVVLRELALAAGELLGMSKASIFVAERPPDGVVADEVYLRVVACAGWQGTLVGQRFPLSAMNTARTAVTERRVVVFDDVQRANDISRPMTFLAQADGTGQTPPSLRAIMQIPLMLEGQVIGLMSLGDERPHRFSEGQQRLARLWGAQAAVTLANAQLHQRAGEALQAQQTLIQQRERLAWVTAAIYAEPELDGALRKIVQLTPLVLGVDGCGVTLTTETPGELLVAAATPPLDRLVGRRLSTPYRPVERMFNERAPRMVSDLSAERELDPIWQQIPDAGSFLTVPLYHANRQPLGLLTLIRRARGVFTREQIEMAQVFAARTATAIENARLHEQARRDAETRAMLLRELNHRVKNNLAGIAGLLAVEEANVPEEARPTLARLAQRVRVMATAHELFTGGAAAVMLRELVEKVVASLSAARPPGADVQLDLSNAAHVALGTDRAVKLAMALNELAFNAMVHGLAGEPGIVQILARVEPAEQSRLFMEVLDDGVGLLNLRSEDSVIDTGDGAIATAVAARVAESTRTGMGLQLVRGLVQSELRGHFTLEPRRTTDGTRAAVEIPLAAGEWSGATDRQESLS
jgi:two-component sensor histidine kinase